MDSLPEEVFNFTRGMVFLVTSLSSLQSCLWYLSLDVEVIANKSADPRSIDLLDLAPSVSSGSDDTGISCPNKNCVWQPRVSDYLNANLTHALDRARASVFVFLCE